ncbi:MAG: FecR family protein [bacterium]
MLPYKRNLFIALTAALIVLFSIGVSNSQDGAVTVAKINGTLEMKKSASADWEKAAQNMEVKKGMWLKTGEGSEAFIRWSSGHVVKLSALTTMRFTTLSYSATTRTEKTNLELKDGRILTNVKKMFGKGSEFEIKTPTAIAGVRGTLFLVEMAEEKSSFVVLEGQLSVMAENVEMIVNESFQTFVESGMPPVEPEEAPADVIQQLTAEAEETEEISKKTAAPGKPGAKPGEEEKEDDTINQSLDNILNHDTQGGIIEEYSIPAFDCCNK